MKASDFPDFYKALYNRNPFPWQTKLAEQVIADRTWPNLLDLPTGSGKTSALDIAVFAFACTGDSQHQMPRRIFYVVDRRIIVDSTFQHASRVAHALKNAKDGILKEVADMLLRLTERDGMDSDADPLHVSILRGGMYREDAWACSPIRPTICISTVDQIGSRLLFRGYGVSPGNWPIHAGLVGMDSLLILDEVHISRPFSQTLSSIERYVGADWIEQKVGRPISVVKMSATPNDARESTTEPFRLSAEDERDETLSTRLNASKIALLEEMADSDQQDKQTAFARKLRNLAYELAWPSPVLAGVTKLKKRAKKRTNGPVGENYQPVGIVGIVVNRVATARAVFELIRSDTERRECEAILLTGRVRPYDRDVLLYGTNIDGVAPGWLRYIEANKQRPQLGRPIFVIATQTIEVGADLDFDALVTEIAPLDVLQQRFGRVDRLGLRGKSRSFVVARSSSVARGADDWLYGEKLQGTWKLLNQIGKKGFVDFGIAALKTELNKLSSEQLRPAVATELAPDAPLLLPAHVDALCQTNPKPAAEPDIALLLHGKEVPAEVQIVWRADLPFPEKKHEEKIIEAVDLLPPTTIESLSLPFGTAKRWLESKAARRRFSDEDTADLEGVAPEDRGRRNSEQAVIALRWCGAERSELISPGKLRPGDTVVVPADFGGLDAFGWNPESHDNVRDISEVCNRIARRELVLRILNSGPTTWLSGSKEDIEEFLQPIRGALDLAEQNEAVSETGEDIVRLLHSTPTQLWAADLLDVKPGELSIAVHPLDGWVLTVDRKLDSYNPAFEQGNYDKFAGEDDSPSLQRGRNRIPLGAHLQAVGDELRFWCSKLSLNAVTNSLCLAGDLHDVGKADSRFQAYLQGGNEVAALRLPEPLAKSGRAYLGREENRRAHDRAHLPVGFRHEALSVAMIANNPAPGSASSDLLLYLVGTHHGYGRPLLPPIEDPVDEQVQYQFSSAVLSAAPNHSLHRLDRGWPDRFWRMVHRFGWWGCAYLEALVRLADHRVSEREQFKDYQPPQAKTQPSIVFQSGEIAHSRVGERGIALTGINGESPLGFLAAMGTFRLLSQSYQDHDTRLSWLWDGNWKPCIHGFQQSTEFLSLLWAALNHDRLSVASFLREHLKEYDNLTIPVTEFRALFEHVASQSTAINRFLSDVYASIGSDSHPSQKGQISDTALRTLSGAGHQHFLGSMRDLAETVYEQHVEAALFSRWKYVEGWKSFRWDPQEDRRYALRAEDPSGKRTQSVPGANRLAFEALPMFPTFASSRQVVTRAFSGRGVDTLLSWPIWSVPISLTAAQSLLSHTELVNEQPNEFKLRQLGVEEVFRSSRITVGHFRNFTPSRACWGATMARAVGA